MSTAGTTNSKKRIPEGWHLVRLGDVTQFQQGGTPPKVHMEYWDGDIPFVTGADLRGIYIGRSNARSFLTKAGLHSGATAICEKGALLLATRTRVGLVGIAGELMGASQDITLLAPTEAADRSYLCRTLINNAGLLQPTVKRYNDTGGFQRRHRFPPHPPPAPAGAAGHRRRSGLH